MDKKLDTLLTNIKVVNGKEFVIVRPGIVATFYLHGSVTATSDAIASSIPRYIDFVGQDSIRGYLAQNGTIKKFSADRLQRDIKVFHSPPANDAGPDLEYSSETNGSVGSFGISVRGNDNDDEVIPLSVSLLRFEFPHDVSSLGGIDSVANFAMDEAIRLGAQSGNIGWGLKRAVPFTKEATTVINAMLPRFLGFDPCYNGFGRLMRGKTPNVNWITFVNQELFEGCGGEKRLRQIAPSVATDVKKGLVFFRAAKSPPIGDKNRGAKDLGAMPEVARFLAPRRVTIGGLGDNKFDVAAWLSRFDELRSQPTETA